ncbi:dTDP-glucose 4,6-dehydratase [Nannocystaceae bacterium ST9]
MTILVTGAAGFIGSTLVRRLRARWPERRVVSLDKLSYCGLRSNLAELDGDPLHAFVQADITDREQVERIFAEHGPTGVIHLAAESHVDRSLRDPLTFTRTNVVGTATLLHVASHAWGERRDVRFHHVSTDEVFGELGHEGRFDERSAYAPNNPYSASKAGADHLVRAWTRCHGLACVISYSSNNFGPRQFIDKLIPVVITRALERRPIPVYGRGANVRDWLFVDDHCAGLIAAFERGRVGAAYCFAGGHERSNLELVFAILDRFDEATGRAPGSSRELVEFVDDRLGHDFRYALDPSLAERELGWHADTSLAEGIAQTLDWYLGNPEWLIEARASLAHA